MQSFINLIVNNLGIGWIIGIFPILVIGLLFFSINLVKWAEVIISKTKFGGGFIGGTLIATITSMPEMITEISQGLSGTPSNGIGDDIGSNAFSVFLIGVGAIVFWKFFFMNSLGKWTKISLGISLILSLILSIFLMLNRYLHVVDIQGWYIGIIPLMFFLFYLVSIWLFYKYSENEEPLDQEFIKKHSVKSAVIWFFIFSLSLIGVSILINTDVSAFQQKLNISTESIGGMFLAITTSLPEIVAFFIFIRKKLPAAAIVSLVGSHFFNLGISFFGDLAYHHGASFNAPDMGRHYPLAIITAIMIFLLLAHAFFAKKFPKKFTNKKYYLFFPSLIILTYVLGWVMILMFN